MQKNLNLKVKYRESFRPFAPSILKDDLTEWFDISVDSPYMLLVSNINHQKKIEMTNEEKITILKGTGIGSMLSFNSNGVPGAAGEIFGNKRLGLSKLYLADGPAGLRISSERENSDKKLYSTAFPVGSLIASTWDKNLAFEIG